ncbi:MAG: hypothetical protein ACHQWV_01625 [Nitrospirales bacterium]
MAKRALIPTAVGLLLLGLIGLGYYHLMVKQSEAFCGFCRRPIHANARVIAEIDGRREVVCCARCAMSEAYQEKKPVRLIEVTDFVSGNKPDPQRAYFVDGSRKVLCSHDTPMFDETKHVEPMTFDRCSPSAFAFARREDAEKFAKENGGIVLRLEEMLRGVDSQGARSQ